MKKKPVNTDWIFNVAIGYSQIAHISRIFDRLFSFVEKESEVNWIEMHVDVLTWLTVFQALVAFKLYKSMAHEAEDDDLEVDVANEIRRYGKWVYITRYHIYFRSLYFVLVCRDFLFY